MPAVEASGSTIVVERAEKALVIRSADADDGAVGFAAELPAEPARATVVVDASAAGALRELDDRLVESLRNRLYADFPPGSEMRLVAARAGRTDPSGAPPLAARLADRLGVGVVAPDGELIALRGGELFSAGPGAGWLGFRRSGEPEWTGPRYPAPAWQSALPRALRPTKPRPLSRLRDRRDPTGRVTVTAIPAGVWVRGAEHAPLPLTDLGFGVPVEPSRPMVLVGAPGERLPGVTDLVPFFRTLPPELRETVVLVPYGQPPKTCVTLAQGLADHLGVAIHGYHALPHYATDGTRRFAIFNTTGTPERLTSTPENLYVPTPTKQRTPRIHPTSLRLPVIDEPTPKPPGPQTTPLPHTPPPTDAGHAPASPVDGGHAPGSSVGGGYASGSSVGGGQASASSVGGGHVPGTSVGDAFEPSIGGPPSQDPPSGGTVTGALTLAAADDSESVSLVSAGFKPVSLVSAGFEPIGFAPADLETGFEPVGFENLIRDPAETTPPPTSPTPPSSTNATVTVDAQGVLRPARASTRQPVAAREGMTPAFPAALPQEPSGPAGEGGDLPAEYAPGSSGVRDPAPADGTLGTPSPTPAASEEPGPAVFRAVASTAIPQAHPPTRAASEERGTEGLPSPATATAPETAAIAMSSEVAAGPAAATGSEGSTGPGPGAAAARVSEGATAVKGSAGSAPAMPLPSESAFIPEERAEAARPPAKPSHPAGSWSVDRAGTRPVARGGERETDRAEGQQPGRSTKDPVAGPADPVAGPEPQPTLEPHAGESTPRASGVAAEHAADSLAAPEAARSAMTRQPGEVDDPGSADGVVGELAEREFPDPGAAPRTTSPVLSAGASVSVPEGGSSAVTSDAVPRTSSRFGVETPSPGGVRVPEGHASSGDGLASEDDGAGSAADAGDQDYDRLWLADRVSTPEERQTFRASLGWRFDAAVRSVARLLAENPGLRSADEDEVMMAELAAVRVFVARDQAALVESLRSGGNEEDRILAACASGGLRRLPSFRGVVVRGGPVETSAVEAYQVGRELVEAAPLIALDDADGHPVGSGAVEIVIWSATARRLTGFADDRGTPQVVFLPGTVFRVLAVDPPQSASLPSDPPPSGTLPAGVHPGGGSPGGPRRVLLAEIPLGKSGPGHEEWAARVLTRLEEAAAYRAAASAGRTGEPPEPDHRFDPLPGDPARTSPGQRSTT